VTGWILSWNPRQFDLDRLRADGNQLDAWSSRTTTWPAPASSDSRSRAIRTDSTTASGKPWNG
jgi:hypothetical protein